MGHDLKQKVVQLGSRISFGNDLNFVLIAGINVLGSRDLALRVGEKLKAMTEKLDIPYVFKASFDKANRSSIHSFRGPGLDEGLRILQDVKTALDVPVITDIHEPAQAQPVAEVSDIIQLPAFLCRQTDLLKAAADTGKIINVKKMQMMAPWDVNNIYQKLEELGCEKILMCERGTQFGYNNLVVDPLSFPELKKFGYPVVFDVTHSLQQPGGLGAATAGRGSYAPDLAVMSISMGISAIFMETHPDPETAKCDGPCATPLDEMEKLLCRLKKFDNLAKHID